MANIKGITIEINGNTTKLVKSLKEVDSEIKGSQRELKELDKLLQLDPGNMDLIKQKQNELANAIEASKKKLEAEKTALEQLGQKDQTATTREQQDALTREIEKTKLSLQNLQGEYDKFGSVAGAKLQAAGEQVKELGDKISSVGDKFAPISAAAGVVGVAAVKITADFDSAMSQVQAISGATGESFQKLRDKALEMGAETKFTAKEAADAMSYMAQAGWKTEEMLSGIPGVLNLAAASNMDLAQASAIVTKTIGGFSLKASDAGHVADVLATAASNSNTNVLEMGEAFKAFAPVAGAVGYSIEDVAVALGLMANAGVTGSTSGMVLRNTLTGLVNPTKEQSEAMEKLGLVTTEYAKKVNQAKVDKAQEKVAAANQKLVEAQRKYQSILAESGGNSAKAVSANALVEKTQINLTAATRRAEQAQKEYDKAVMEHGSSSEQARAAYSKLQDANDKVRKSTLDVTTAQAKYRDVMSQTSNESDRAISARERITKAEEALKKAKADLAQAYEGEQKKIATHNILLDDGTGKARSFEQVMQLLRVSLGGVDVACKDSTGELREFDDILADVSKAGADNTQVQTLQAAATIFGKRAIAGMLAVIKAGQGDYNGLSEKIENSTYNLNAMLDSLKSTDIDWSSFLNTQMFKGDTDATVKYFAQAIAKMITDAQNGGKSLDEAMSDVVSELANGSEMDVDKVRQTVKVVVDEMQKFPGTAKAMADTMLNNLNGQLTIIGSGLERFGISIGDALMPTIRAIAEKVQDVVNWFNALGDSSKTMIAWGVVVVAGVTPVLKVLGFMVSGFGDIITGAGKLASFMSSKLIPHLGDFAGYISKNVLPGIGSFASSIGTKLVTAFSSLGTMITGTVLPTIGAFLTNPITLTIAAIAAAITAVILVIKNWGAIVEWLGGLWEDFKDSCRLLWNILPDGFKNAAKAICDVLSGIGDFIVELFTHPINFGKMIWDGLESGIIWCGERIKGAWNAIWGALPEGLQNALSSVLDTVKRIFSPVIDFIGGIFTSPIETLKSTGQSLIDAVANVGNSIGNVFSEAGGLVKKGWSLVWSALPEDVQAMAKPLLKDVTSVCSSVYNYFADWGSSVADFFSGLWDNPKEALKTLGASTLDELRVIRDGWNAFWRGLPDVISDVGKWCSDKWNGVCESIGRIWEKSGAKDTWASFATSASSAWNAIVSGCGEMFDSLFGATKAYATDNESQWNTIRKSTSAIGDGLASYLTTAWSHLCSFLESSTDESGSGVSDGWERMKKSVSDITKNFTSSIKNLWSSLTGNVSKESELLNADTITTWKKLATALENENSEINLDTLESWKKLCKSLGMTSDELKETLGGSWENIKASILHINDSMAVNLGLDWGTLSDNLSKIMDTIKASVSEKWVSLKESTLSIFANLKNDLGASWDVIKSVFTDKILSIKDSALNLFGSIWDSIKGVIDRLKSCFNFEWSLPKIKLPHISIKGEFSLSPPSVPWFSIDWYKKAMDDAYILNSPTIFGAAGGKLLGGGEAGSEAVVGTAKLGEIVRDAMTSVSSSGTTVIPVYIGQERIEEIVVRANQNINYRSGGR